MANKSETGHLTNAANFELVIAMCIGYGPAYNPSREALKLDALQLILINANTTNGEVSIALANSKNASTDRLIAFSALETLATKIMNAVESSETASENDEKVKYIVQKIRGVRIGDKKTDEEKATLAAQGKEVKEISTAQTGFINLIGHFTNLSNLLVGMPKYMPNETELTAQGISELCIRLKNLYTVAESAKSTLRNTRNWRDEVLYKDDTGLYDIHIAVNKYVKSVFGPNSPQYKQICKIKFTKPR
jgi:hypothetical protein